MSLKIAVTGGAGNIGHHLISYLSSKYRVTSIDLQASNVSGVDSIVLNLMTEPDKLTEVLKGKDLVINMANWPTAHEVGEERVLVENTLMTYNVFTAVSKSNVPRVIHLSSESAMGFGHRHLRYDPVPHYLPIDEEHPNLPAEAYSYSKLFGEVICEGFHRVYGIKCTIIRFSWVMTDRGLEMFKKDVYPYIKDGTIMTMVRAKKMHPFGPYTAIQDLCEGIGLAVEHSEIDYDTFLIVGPTTFLPIPTLEAAREYYGKNIKITKPEYYEKEPRAPFFDYTKATRILGYVPKYRIEDLVNDVKLL